MPPTTTTDQDFENSRFFFFSPLQRFRINLPPPPSLTKTMMGACKTGFTWRVVHHVEHISNSVPSGWRRRHRLFTICVRFNLILNTALYMNYSMCQRQSCKYTYREMFIKHNNNILSMHQRRVFFVDYTLVQGKVQFLIVPSVEPKRINVFLFRMTI